MTDEITRRVDETELRFCARYILQKVERYKRTVDPKEMDSYQRGEFEMMVYAYEQLKAVLYPPEKS